MPIVLSLFLNVFANANENANWMSFVLSEIHSPGWFYVLLICLLMIQVTWKMPFTWDYTEGIIGVYIGYTGN